MPRYFVVTSTPVDAPSLKAATDAIKTLRAPLLPSPEGGSDIEIHPAAVIAVTMVDARDGNTPKVVQYGADS